MLRVSRLLIAAIFFVAFAGTARSQDGQYPIKADDGSIVANHQLTAELAGQVEKLPGIVIVGNPKGKVTLAEFYDYNCPYCRKASADIDELLRENPELRLVLVPFAVLGVPSILAARIEYAVAKLASPQQFYKFHRAVYAGRGVVDDKRAFAAAQSLGLDMNKVGTIANEEAFAKVMTAHVRLGDALKIQATPGFVIKGVAIVGYPGKAAMAKVIQSALRCGKVVC